MDAPPPRADTAYPGQTDSVAMLHALREIAATDDARDLLRRALTIACRSTGAAAGLLGVHDEAHPGELAQVHRHRLDPGDPLVRRLLRGQLEDVGDDGPVLRADILVDGDHYGTLQLARWPQPPGPRERVLAETVAAAVGLQVDTLRQRRISELHERVTQAVWEVDRTLVDEVDLDVSLPLLAARVREITGADVVVLVGTRDEGGHRVLAASGEMVGQALAELGPDLTEVLRGSSAHHWTTTTGHPAGPVTGRLQEGLVGTSLVPLDTRGTSPVVLVVHRWRPPQGVSHQRVHDVLSAVALHASIILDREQGEREHDLLTLLEDRDRIARDLHDLVIQRLFAVGLTLQGAARRAVRPEVMERLENAVAELDQTIRDIRATIFELRHHPGAGTFRADLRQLVESYGPTLGFAPVVMLTGPLDAITDDESQTQVLMVVREALSNVARHAHATSVTVETEVTGEQLVVTVTDDGVGLPDSSVESGLANVRARAREHGGVVELSRVEPHGTCLRWSVPV
ncbi:sensor histidine kinase [Ornithinimicrobium cerasi]|uniref:sensor histidine kinase n=1 Tax=Ornithinimicrobium cerasi TaxID=2248773 RepID=UPI000F00425A|nr:sensor histidine kinase [Ornithinimicrobium cerasi]